MFIRRFNGFYVFQKYIASIYDGLEDLYDGLYIICISEVHCRYIRRLLKFIRRFHGFYVLQKYIASTNGGLEALYDGLYNYYYFRSTPPLYTTTWEVYTTFAEGNVGCVRFCPCRYRYC